MNDFNRFNYPKERTETRASVLECPDKDVRDYKHRSHRTIKIVAIILLSLIVLYLLNTIFINPLRELNFKIAIGNSCRLRITVQQPNRYEETISIKADKNLISIKENRGQEKYYEIDGDDIYELVQDNTGSWKKIKRNDFMEFHNDEYKALENILDPNNYERADGKLFVWTVKEGVFVGSYRNIELKRRLGKTTITVMNGFTRLTFKFDRIGFADVDMPKDE